MHKHRPAGLFDFAERSIRYLIGFWFTAGIFLSVLVHTGILVWRDSKRADSKRDATSLEAAANARKPASANTPPASDAVRY